MQEVSTVFAVSADERSSDPMTSREWLADILAQGPRSELLPLELRLIFRQLHDNLPMLKLRNGNHLRDSSDVMELCREMIDLLSPPKPAQIGVFTATSARERFPFHETCPDCGHVHTEENECGEKLGGDRVCRCERKVVA
jgi:hypothetical protein